MEILVVDLEATCWRGFPPKGQEQEILEIGTTVVDTSRIKAYSNRSYLCRPVRSEVSRFCTELTSITPEMVEAAPTVGEQLLQMKMLYGDLSKCWASWGDFDRNLFFKQSLKGDFVYPFGPRHINLKLLFGVLTGIENCSTIRALEHFKLDFEGTLHRAGDDSKNIANVFLKMIETYKKGGKNVI